MRGNGNEGKWELGKMEIGENVEWGKMGMGENGNGGNRNGWKCKREDMETWGNQNGRK